MTTSDDIEAAIEASHQALDRIARGDAEAFLDLYSHAEDATLANPITLTVRPEICAARTNGYPSPPRKRV